MSSITSRSVIDHAVKLIQSGITLKKIGEIVGVNPDCLSRHIRKRGIQTNIRRKEIPHNFIKLNVSEIAKKYIDGQSENSLAKQYAVSRNVIRTRLVSNGVHIRGQREAETIKWKNMSKTQRLNQTRKAHLAAKGRKPSLDNMKKIANARCKRIGE